MIFNVFLIFPLHLRSLKRWIITEWSWNFFKTRSQNGPISVKWKHQFQLIFCILRLFHKPTDFDSSQGTPCRGQYISARRWNIVNLFSFFFCTLPFAVPQIDLKTDHARLILLDPWLKKDHLEFLHCLIQISRQGTNLNSLSVSRSV